MRFFNNKCFAQSTFCNIFLKKNKQLQLFQTNGTLGSSEFIRMTRASKRIKFVSITHTLLFYRYFFLSKFSNSFTNLNLRIFETNIIFLRREKQFHRFSNFFPKQIFFTKFSLLPDLLYVNISQFFSTKYFPFCFSSPVVFSDHACFFSNKHEIFNSKQIPRKCVRLF